MEVREEIVKNVRRFIKRKKRRVERCIYQSKMDVYQRFERMLDQEIRGK